MLHFTECHSCYNLYISGLLRPCYCSIILTSNLLPTLSSKAQRRTLVLPSFHFCVFKKREMATNRPCCIPFSTFCCIPFSSFCSDDEEGQDHPASAGAPSSPSATDNSIGTHQRDKAPVSKSLNIQRKPEGKNGYVDLNVLGVPQCNEASSSGSSNVPMKHEGEYVDANLKVSGATHCDEAPSSGSPNVPVDANLNVSGAASCNEAPSSSSSSSRVATTSSSSRGASKSAVINTILHKDIEEVDGEKVAVNIDELMKHISELLKLREEEMRQNDERLSNPSGMRQPDERLSNPRSFPWPAVRGWNELKAILSWGTDLEKLKELLSSGLEVVSELKDIISGPITKVLNGIGKASVATAGLLVVAYALERFDDLSNNKENCWALIKEMTYFATVVKILKQSPKGTQENVIFEEATLLIVEAAIKCCTLIGHPAWKSFFSASKDKDDLSGIREKLNVKYMQINMEIGFRVLAAIECKGRSPLSKRYPTHAVGMDKPIEEVLRLLEIESEKKAVTVILHSFGGMGKTTLADAVFSHVGGCKYSKVRLFKDINSTPVIEELQTQILEDLMEPGETIPKITAHEEGQRELEVVLGKIHAFIYVDNVLDGVALKKLLPQDMTRAKKVRFLLTARDENVKNACPRSRGKPTIYRMEGIQDQEAMLILKKEIEDGILNETQLNEIIQICGKIPLMLTLAAPFIGRADDRHEAYSTLMRQKDKWASEEFKEMRYAFAYDALRQDYKDPFLDICSYFKGWDWHTVEDIVGKDELQKLESRALVTRTQNGVASVHDVILKLAQQMSKEESKGKQVRLSFTSARELMAYLEEKKEGAAEGIKGIWLSDNNHVLQISASRLDSMHNSLRVLQLGKLTEVEGKCSEIFEKLVFFEAKVRQLPFLDVSKLKQLRYLSYAPNELKLSKMPSSLRHMEFDGSSSHSQAFQISSKDLQQHEHLRILRLVNFSELKILPEELGDQVKGLQELSLSNCKSIEKLPYSISKLPFLRILKMDNCSNLTELPVDFGSLSSLQELNLSGCYQLEALPDSVDKLSSLKLLNLSGCSSLSNLPQGLGKLTCLVELHLKSCVRLQSIPDSIGELKLLRALNLEYCKNLKELPDGFCNLSFIRHLSFERCYNLQKLPDGFGQLKSLKVLDMSSTTLQKLPEGFGQLKNLERLNLARTKLRELCNDFHRLSSLQQLDLTACTRLEKLPLYFHCLNSLQFLYLTYCIMLEGKSMDHVAKMNTLQVVEIGGNDELVKSGSSYPSVITSEDRTENSEPKTTCGVDKLKGKTVLVEMCRYNPWRKEIEYHQFWKEVYFMEKEKVDLEIISIPIVYPSKHCDVIDVYKQFSREVPWLVLQNSWTVITRAVKFFLEKHGGWEERDEICEQWYPTINWIIEPNGRISVYRPSIFLKEEWEQPKHMSTLEFLFNHLESVSPQVQKLMLPGKLICLYRGGDHDEEVLYSIWNALDQQQRDRIHIIHLGRRKMESFQFTMNSKKDYYYPLKNTAEIEGMSSLNLSENEILRFSLRLCHLEKEINRMEDSELKFLLHSFQPLHSFQNGPFRMYGSIAFMDGGGKVVAALGGKFLDSLFHSKDRAERFIKSIMNDIEGGGGGKEMHDEDPRVSAGVVVEQQNMDANFDSLREYTSERWDVELYQAIRFNKEGKKRSLPRVTWPTSGGFCRLKNFLSEGINDDWVKDVISGHPENRDKQRIVIHSLLKGIEEALWAVAGLLAVADILERSETISANRMDCLFVLEKMFRVAQYIQQFNQKPELWPRGVKRVATAIILAGSIQCCSQIDESKFALISMETLESAEWRLTEITEFFDRMANEITGERMRRYFYGFRSRLEEMCHGFHGFRFFVESGDEGGPSCEGESGVEGGSTAGTSGEGESDVEDGSTAGTRGEEE